MGESWLLLGAPGVGKSTFSFELKQRVQNLKLFSVRLYTYQLLERDCPLGRYLRENNLVKPKVYMPDKIVEEIFCSFLEECLQDDFLLIEGFPTNKAQFEGMIRQLTRADRAVDGVLVLEDSLEHIQERVKKRRICGACEKKNGAGLPIPPNAEECPFCGGPLTLRPEDDPDFFRMRFQLFLEELERIHRWFPDDRIHTVQFSPKTLEKTVQYWAEKSKGGGK